MSKTGKPIARRQSARSIGSDLPGPRIRSFIFIDRAVEVDLTCGL